VNTIPGGTLNASAITARSARCCRQTEPTVSSSSRVCQDLHRPRRPA
jgi:hypothetical protein